jgi:FMN-dependent NADH-azoreductase
MTLFRLDASIRTEGSVSRAIADTVQQAWQAERPGHAVIRRDVGIAPLPATTWSAAALGAWTPAEHRTPEQLAAAEVAAELAGELADADAYLFAVPLYNWGVSQHFKTWVDLVISDPRFRPGVEPATAGRPAVLVAVRGGGYRPGSPKEGWDHATPWMRRILAEVFQLDLHVVETELTLAGVNPAMEPLRPLAAELLAAAHVLAQEHGRTLAERVAAAV